MTSTDGVLYCFEVVYIQLFLIKNQHLNKYLQTSVFKLNPFTNGFSKLSSVIDVEPYMTE